MEVVWMIPITGCLLFYVLFVLPTQWLKIERQTIPLGLDRKILHLSDLHVEKNRISPDRLKTIIMKECVDAVFFTGDFTAKEKYIPLIHPYLSAVKDAGIEMYAVLGNHDYRTWRLSTEIKTFLKNQGVNLLVNESVEFPDFTLVGLDFYMNDSLACESAFRTSNQKPVIVLCHDPSDLIRTDQNRFDLMLSGHLHGKQFNVPFFFTFVKKGVLATKGIYKGLHKFGSSYLYISKGIGQAHWNLRFGVRSEVTIIDLYKNDKVQ